MLNEWLRRAIYSTRVRPDIVRETVDDEILDFVPIKSPQERSEKVKVEVVLHENFKKRKDIEAPTQVSVVVNEEDEEEEEEVPFKKRQRTFQSKE